MAGDKQCVVIFDVDGTLVDSTYHHAMAWTRAFRERDLDVPVWRVHRAIGMGGDRLVAALSGDEVEDRLGDQLRDGWHDAYEDLRDTVRALPGAKRLVERLHREGFVVCIASSGSSADTEAAVALAGIGDYVTVRATGDDVDKSKPAPDAVEHVWREVGAGPAVVVGDSVYDVQAAARLHLPCIGVLTGGIAMSELRDAGARDVVEDLTSLTPDMLRSVSQAG